MSPSSQNILTHVVILVIAIVLMGGVYLLFNDIGFTIASGVLLVAFHLIAATGLVIVAARAIKRRTKTLRPQDHSKL